MNNAVLLAVSMAACLLGGILRKFLTDRYENGIFAYQFYNAAVSLTAAVALFAVSGVPEASPFTVMLALLFGLVTLIQQVTNLQALEAGPLSYTTVIISLSTLIPTLSGAAIWDEKISAVQVAGIILMVACFVLSVEFGGEKKKASFRWLAFCLAAFLCTGFIGVMQKWHQSTPYSGEQDAFLIIAFAFSFISSAAYCAVAAITKKGLMNKDKESGKKKILALVPLIIMLVSGVCVAANNKLNLHLSGVMESAVFFPTVNGGGLVLTLLASIAIFKEKLSAKQWVGMALGIVSVILLCNPF